MAALVFIIFTFQKRVSGELASTLNYCGNFKLFKSIFSALFILIHCQRLVYFIVIFQKLFFAVTIKIYKFFFSVSEVNVLFLILKKIRFHIQCNSVIYLDCDVFGA